MIISTLLSFFGGTAFRMVWGEISSWITARQDHKFEIERMQAQEAINAADHSRNLEAMKVQAELKIEVITQQGDVDISKIDAESFGRGVEGLSKLSGFKPVDAWKASIQPALATMIMFLLVKHYAKAGWVMDEHGWELAGGVLGLFIADRMLFRRGK